MTRPWHIWLAFALCLIIVLAAMGWTSLTVLQLEEQSRKQAVKEENVRLALWRMDSALAPLLAEETALPYFAYGAFYPADRAYDEMFGVVRNGEKLLPSPLLSPGAPHALLYFQFDPDGHLTSPQIPPKTKMKIANAICASPEKVSEAVARLGELKALASRELLIAELPEEPPLPPVQVALGDNNNDSKGDASKESPSAKEVLPNAAANNGYNFNSNDVKLNTQSEIPLDNAQGNVRMSKSSAEWQKREKSYQETAQAVVKQSQYGNEQVIDQPANFVALNRSTRQRVSAGLPRPVWVENSLLLARRVSVGGKVYVQGCWLNWEWLQSWLLSDVRDLLPDARLVKAPDGGGERAANMLAALPAKLLPGSIVPLDPAEGLSPVRISLIVAWCFALLAAAAVASLLFGILSLSERRATFVSSVTHELRTPLTTFRIYAEMLSGGMVPAEADRRSYLETLRIESERLSHLVENVLAYARLERGSARSRVETVSLARLIESVKGRLGERASHAGMSLVFDLDPACAEAELSTDISAVEQIVFNLVDNACKYAAGATRREVQIEARCASGKTALRVRDFGPGISAVEARRLFQPFSKSAHQAAHSAPGVGLGLALSRRLARDLGGELRLVPKISPGACFELTLKSRACK